MPTTGTYLGLGLVTMATLSYEIILTRIFSVTMWYHFAFVAISVAMFGLTVGAIIVYLRPAWFTPRRLPDQLGSTALGFGVAAVVSFLLHTWHRPRLEFSLPGLASTFWTYGILALPFVLSGVCVCLALTKYPSHVGRLYAVDLLGAALGCLLVVGLLNVTDGPTAVAGAAAIACLGGAFFASQPRLRWAAGAATIALGGFAALHTLLVHQHSPLVRLTWVKGSTESRPLYEKWNSFSRITVYGDPTRAHRPRGWGLSPLAPAEPVRQLMLLIDAGAGTVLTAFDGDRRPLEHLRYDVTNLPHYLRRDATVLVIGAGGGRDVLSALLFNQRSVVAVEVNQDIIDIVNRRFGHFTGHLDLRPGVRFVADEARAYLARRPERFDIIQISLIDTWAATAAGAFVLTENSLYTVEAWQLFLSRLAPDGILSVSRFYFSERPDEFYRLTALASAALRRRGIPDPRRHILIARQVERRGGQEAPVGLATLLVSPTPFAPADVAAFGTAIRDLQFELVLTPDQAADAIFAGLAAAGDPAPLLAAFPVDVAPPTDDRPFFFHMLRFRDAVRHLLGDGHANNINMNAVSVLGALLVTVLVFTVLCIVVPLGLTSHRHASGSNIPLFVFFGGIGLGFMLVEISQMQRLIIFLGHPTYSLSVVLVVLLAASGVGSFLAARAGSTGPMLTGWLPALLTVLAAFGVATPAAIHAFAGASTGVRIVVSAAILTPLGVVMGMAFPTGMGLAAERDSALAPWLWGINGAASVCASVLAVVIALGAGITAAFWTGVACYALASAALLWTARRDPIAVAPLPNANDS
jgi:hypothetical protein